MRGVGRKLGLSLATIGAIGVCMSLAAGASAATIPVTSAADPAGTATQCTLRQAIQSATDDATPSGSNCTPGSGPDGITFPPALMGATITLTSGELGINTDVDIQGPGVTQLTVDANLASRVFHVTGGNVAISAMKITRGRASFADGGGILVDSGATLAVHYADVAFNTATMSFDGTGSPGPTAQRAGGGIANGTATGTPGGNLTVTDSTVRNNSVTSTITNGGLLSVTARGGGIYSIGGTLQVTRSTINNNSAAATSSGGTTGNFSEAEGGGIQIFTSGASVASSTIAANSATASATGTGAGTSERGGGISIEEQTVTATSDTLTSNSASTGANLEASSFGTPNFIVQNTIAADPLGTGANCAVVTSAGHNFSSDASCDPDGTGDVQNGTPNLLSLGTYGGTTQTRPPAPPTVVNNGVIDLGVEAGELHDQRGLDRTVDYNIADGPGGDGTDIGAVEIQGATPTGTTPESPADDDTPLVFGTSEPNTLVDLFQNATCTSPEIDIQPAATFVSPGIAADGPLDPNTATDFTAQAEYGTAVSECSPTPVTYLRRPAAPTLTSSNPASGGDNNGPSLIGTATASSTVNLYTVAGCTGSIAGTGTGINFAATGIPVSVPDNSTTTFYAQATGVGGTSDCSAGLSYTEVTPPAPTPPNTNPTPVPTPAPKKCKKGFKLKKVKGKKKCVRKKKK